MIHIFRGILLWTAFVAINSSNTAHKESKNILICYWKIDSVYRPEPGRMLLKHVDPKLCTHLVYLSPYLEYGDLQASSSPYLQNLKGNKQESPSLLDLKSSNPDLKILFSYGRGAVGNHTYTAVSKDDELLKEAVSLLKNCVLKHGFDGLEFAWDYPDIPGTALHRKTFLTKILEELKKSFKPHNLILSLAASGDRGMIDEFYDVPSIVRIVDFVAVMTLDYYSEFETTTGHHSPLFPKPFEVGEGGQLNTDWTVKYWIKLGAPASKLVICLAAFGRHFTLQSVNKNKLGSPTLDVGKPGPYIQRQGMIAYNEMTVPNCVNRTEEPWTVVWDLSYKAPYAYMGDQWTGFHNPDSMSIHTDYAKQKGLYGVAIWTIDYDDFHGSCEGKFPLLSRVHSTLFQD